MSAILNSEVYSDAIILLLNDNTAMVKTLVGGLCEVIDTELKNNTKSDDASSRFYLELMKELLQIDPVELGNDITRQGLLLKFQSHHYLTSNKEVKTLILKILGNTDKITEARKIDLITNIRNKILWYNSFVKVKSMFGKLNNYNSTVDKVTRDEILEGVNGLAREINQIFTTIKSNANSAKERIDFSDKVSILRALSHHKTTKQHNILKMGLQGLNRMFGKRGGIALGESVVFNALSHHYKSCMLMNIARWTVQYNTPHFNDSTGGIPTVLLISLENEAAENMMSLYKDAYTSITNEDTEGKSDEEIIEFIYDFFNQNGWRLIVERRLGQTFGDTELETLVKEYQSAGHRIVMTIIDYMNMMKKKGNDSVGNHLKLRELYTNVVNFLKHEGSSLVTAHQLNRDAAKIAASGATNIVDKFGIGYLADGMDPQREVDAVVFIHIEKHNNTHAPYLTARIDKHRYVNDTPEVWKKTAYRFTPLGILDDINGPDQSIRDIYSDKYVPTGKVLKAVNKQLSTLGDTGKPIEPGEEVFME